MNSPARPASFTVSVEMTEERMATYSLERAQRVMPAGGEPIEETLRRADAIEAWLRAKLNPSAPTG